LAKFAFLTRINFNFQPKISDSLKISDFSDRLGVSTRSNTPMYCTYGGSEDYLQLTMKTW